MPKKKTNGHQLAKAGDPLVMADGTTLMPHANPIGDQPKTVKMTAQSFRPTSRRALKEIAAPVPVLNAIGAVFLYSMYGLGDREIIDALRITHSQLNQIRNHDVYTEFFDLALSEFINANSGLLHSRIAAFADVAVDTVGTLAKEGKHEGTRLKASTDILDRAGIGQKKSDNAMASNELRIVFVDGKDRGVELELNGERLDNG